MLLSFWRGFCGFERKDLLSGFISEQQCLGNLKEKMDTWKQFKDATFAKNTVTFSGNNTTMTYLCLPDTEDPRRKPAVKGGR
jgi:hypothetical protein